jgi:hypothetical protein
MTQTESLPSASPELEQRERDDAEWQANQQGRLSTRQRLLYLGVRAAEHGIGALLVMLVGALIVNALRLAPDFNSIATTFMIIVAGTVLFWALNIRPAFEARVKSVHGILHRAVIEQSWLQPLFCITIGKLLFYVEPLRFADCEDDAAYTAHYIERPARLGGAVLVSLRKVGEAPDYPDSAE